MNIPRKEYELTSGDAGYFIMVTVSPKHIRCDAGEPVSIVTKKPITVKEIKADNKILITDFSNISTKNQSEVIPGFWTLYSLELSTEGRFLPSTNERDAWRYGEGTDGGENEFGLLQTGRYARLGYTPVGKEFSDMNIKMRVAPMKTAGQGFSIANLFMDVLLKFDMKTMTGYALRFIRTTKYHDAVDCLFVKYENGKIEEISKPVSTTCYRTPCIISIEVKSNKITAHAESPAEYYLLPGRPELVTEVNIETEIVPDKSGGFGINYAGGSTAVIKELKVEWE
jgi:hypothetical protein